MDAEAIETKTKELKWVKLQIIYQIKYILQMTIQESEAISKIRNDIKKGIKKQKVLEFPNRAKAISEAINHLNTGEILLVAGKGHETVQEIGKRKFSFQIKKYS